LELAIAWGYLEPSSLALALSLLDRELAMLYKLSGGKMKR